MHARFPQLLSAALVACVPVLGLVMAVGPAAGASTAGAHPAQHARAAAAARAALTQLMVGQHGTDHRVPGHHPRIKGLSQVQSGNWSGYADTGATFSTATGHWTEPSVSCGSQTSLAAFWVGIDGYSSSSVEQDGTLAECYQGSAYYYTWWEMYPSNAIQVVGSTCGPATALPPRWPGAAAATRSRSPIPPAPATASAPPRAARAAPTPAPSGSRRRRAAPPG